MMAAPRSAFEVRRQANAPLTAIEQRVLEHYRAAAVAGQMAPPAEQIAIAIGADGVSTVAGITKRLEAKGYITRQVFQRGRTICITATGQCTLPPRDTSPHWRLRTESVPTPAIQSIREKSKPLSAMIEAEGRISGKHMTDFLADLVYIGWHAYMAEKEGEIG